MAIKKNNKKITTLCGFGVLSPLTGNGRDSVEKVQENGSKFEDGGKKTGCRGD